jgi:hypothetical protein
MIFNALINTLQSVLPMSTTLGVHLFKLHDVQLQLAGNDDTVSAMVTPGAPFASYLLEGGCLSFQGNAPESKAITGFDSFGSLMFRHVQTAEDAPLLIRTLLLIADFEHQLRETVCAMWEEALDPRWTTTIHPSCMLTVEHARGSIWLTRFQDRVQICAQPIGCFVVSSDVLEVGEAHGSALMLSFHLPDDEDRLRGAMAALVTGFRAHLDV